MCLFLAFVLMPLSGRTKDLGAVDAHLAWLYCLPLSGRGILSGQFVSMILVRPLVWIVAWPFFGVLLWAMGHGWSGLLLGAGVALALSVAAAGIELAAETWLRTKADFNLKKNVQSAAGILGVLAFYACLAAGLSAGRSAAWLEWLLAHTPVGLTSLPGGVLMLPAGGTAGLLSFAGILFAVAAACGGGGWLLAARALRRGFSSGNEREGSRPGTSVGTGLHRSLPSHAGSRSLAKFEWLLLRRDRNLATLVLIVPLLLVFFQALVNPELLEDLTARKLAVLGFGCGAWAAAVAAPHVPLSESRSLWLIFSLPVEIGRHFQRRARVWRMSGVTMAALVIVGLASWKGFPPGDWWRLPAALAAVWVVSLAIYAVMIGATKLPDPGAAERPKIGVLRMYGCMIMGGIVGSVLWLGTAWQMLAALVLWWFFGFGLWQGVVHRLRHVLDPTEDAPRELTVASALGAVILFFLVQMIAIGAGLLASYLIAGVVSLLFCAARWPGLPKQTFSPGDRARLRLLPAVAGTTAGCIAAGAAWLAIIRLVPTLHQLQIAAQQQAGLILDLNPWALVVLVVVAAPVIEELLFRGYVFRVMLRAWSPRGAIAANALLFAIVHPALSFPAVLVLGLACAWLCFRSGALWPGMIAHAVYNAAVLLMNNPLG